MKEKHGMEGLKRQRGAVRKYAYDGDWYVYFDTKPDSGGELRMSLNNDDIHFYKNYDDVEVPSEFGVGWGDSIAFDPIEFGYDDPSILELADGWEILDLVDTILIERSYSGMYSASYEKNAGSNPEDYITKDDLTDVFEDDDILYYVGRSPEGKEIGVEIDWNAHALEYVCTIDGTPYTSFGVYDFMDEDGKYFDEAVKALSVCVFEKEHNMKFPRDYWGRPIIGRRNVCRICGNQHNGGVRRHAAWHDDPRRVEYEDDLIAVYGPNGELWYKGIYDYAGVDDGYYRFDEQTGRYVCYADGSWYEKVGMKRVAEPRHVAQERTVDSDTWWSWVEDACDDINRLVGGFFGKPVEIFGDIDNYGTHETRVDVKVNASTNSISEMDLEDLREVLHAAVRAIDYAKDLSGWTIID